MQKLQGPLNVQFINEKFFGNYKDVSNINKGECFLWAYFAYRLYKNIELWDMDCHAFVRDKITGKFYDAERPNGEEDWRDLPATNFGVGCSPNCKRCKLGVKKFQTAGRFRLEWIRMVNIFKTNWNKVNKEIKKTIKDYTK